MVSPLENPQSYAVKVQQIMVANAALIQQAAQFSGISAISIAGPIAREMNKEIIDYSHNTVRQWFVPIKDWMVTFQDIGIGSNGPTFQTDASLRADLAFVRQAGISNTGTTGNLNRLLHVSLNDIGPGKFQVGTAIESFDFYKSNLELFGGSDSLDLLKYDGHVDLLIRDLNDPVKAMAPTIALSAVIGRQSSDWFSAKDMNWSSRSEFEKAALITTWYTAGKKAVVDRYNFQTNGGLQPGYYNPDPASAEGGSYFLYGTNPQNLNQWLQNPSQQSGALPWNAGIDYVTLPTNWYSTADIISLAGTTTDAAAGTWSVVGENSNGSLLETVFGYTAEGGDYIVSQTATSADRNTITTRDTANQYDWDFNTTKIVNGVSVEVDTGLDSGATVKQIYGADGRDKIGGGIANDRIEVTGVARPITRAGSVSFSNLSSELSATNPFGLAPVQAGTLETGAAGAAIGNFVGTTLGKYLVGDNIFAQVAVGSVLGTVLGAVGAGQFGALFGSGDGGTKAVESIANHLSADFGTQFANNVKTAGIGALSSFLTAELAESLNINSTDGACPGPGHRVTRSDPGACPGPGHRVTGSDPGACPGPGHRVTGSDPGAAHLSYPANDNAPGVFEIAPAALAA